MSTLCFLTILVGISPKFALAAEEKEVEPSIAFAARIVGDANRGRLIVDFDKKVAYQTYSLDNPKRIIVDLSETVFSLKGEGEKLPKELVAALRFGTVGPGQSRMVIELAKPLKIENHLLKKVENETRYRLIVDIVASTEEAFAKSVRPKPKKPKEEKKSSVVPSRKFIIVIDAGHGGIDGGAAGLGKTVEKDVTLSFAKILRDALLESPEFEVVLTRDSDVFLRLKERVKLARNAKADLLISVHADSLGQKYIRGATVYSLSKKGSDEIARSLASQQNRADLIAGLELPTEKEEVVNILIDLTRRETKSFSNLFAEQLVAKLKQEIRLIGNPHRSADFYVLKAPEIPSILLELGYLSNAEDEKLLKDGKWQMKVADRTKDAILQFFKPRMGQN